MILHIYLAILLCFVASHLVIILHNYLASHFLYIIERDIRSCLPVTGAVTALAVSAQELECLIIL